MEQLKLAKTSADPMIYSGTSATVFPFDTRGYFVHKDTPLPQARYAGYKPEVNVTPLKDPPMEEPYSFHNNCFETAIDTIVPCYEKHSNSFKLCVNRYYSGR